MYGETENQTILRRAKEAVATLHAAETEARKALAAATESTRRARARYEELFCEEENAERARRMKDYRHCAK